MPAETQEQVRRLFVIDGPAAAYQAFHAISGLTAEDGSPTGAVYGFVAMLRKILRQESPDYLAVAWDPPGPTFRHEIAEDYKATRAPMPEDLAAQLPVLFEVISAHRIPLVEVKGYEADDVMATLARRGEDAGLDVVLVTRDKDAKQLLSPHVRLYDSKKEKTFGPEELLEATGLEPSQWIDYQSLVGDSTDNIKGAPGIGEKTALKLLTTWKSIASAYEHLEEVEPKRVRGLLDKARDAVVLAEKLVALDTDMPLDVDLEDLRRVDPDDEALAALYRRLGFRRFLEETGMSRSKAQLETEVEYELVVDTEALARVARDIVAAGRVAIAAIPATSGPAATGKLAGLGLSWRAGTGVYVPLSSPALELDADAVAGILRPILCGDRTVKIAHGLKAALQLCARTLRTGDAGFGGQCEDTSLLSYLISSTARSYNLDALALQHLDHRAISPVEVLGKGAKAAEFESVALARVTEYAAEAADLTLRLFDVLTERLAAAGLEPVYRDIEIPLVPVLGRLEMLGMLVDPEALRSMSEELASEIETLQARADSEASESVKLGSTKELARILFDVRGLEPVKRGKTGPSTDAESLEAIHAQTDDPLCGIILRWRELTKLKSTYIDALPALIDPGTGRIHTTLHQNVAATGRLSSSDPNLQNIPVRTELGRRIRSAFVAPPGHQLVAGDYSQIELRVLAHYCGDENLCAAFRDGQDIHTRVAAEIEGVDLPAVTADMRRRAKAVNFGIVYGQSAFGLARELGISRQDAQAFIDGYFENFPGVRTFIDETIAQAGNDGEVRTMAGRRRPIPDLKVRDHNRRNLAERTAVNTVIQGSAADIIKLAMIALDKSIAAEERPERMLLQIHDELLLECPEGAVAEAEAHLARMLSTIVEMAVPLVVNTSTATNWGEISK